MGRTQVARNQRKGRPGDRGKGRGGGRGRDEQGESHKKATKQAVRVPSGGNSFRYDSYDDDRKEHNNRQEVNDADVDEWDHLAIGDQYKYVPTNRSLPMDDTIGIGFGFGDKHDDDSNVNVGQKNSLDISKLASCLEKLNSAVWMRFSDDDLLRDYDDRIGKKGEEKMTISEMAACPIPIQVESVSPVSSPVSAPALVDVLSIKIEKELKISSDDENNIDNESNSSSDGQEGDDDDDDLDAWLDEVIEI